MALIMKEYSDTVKKNKKDRLLHTAPELLSGLCKEDRLHAVITLCVYYGETVWDGPHSLLDMIRTEGIPASLKSYVNDYRMHLVQINDSDAYRFQNTEVQDFFAIMRSIYRRDYHTMKEVYGTREISAELGLAIGVAAKSGILIRKALKMNDNGGLMNMCTALKELMNEGIEQGKREGIEQGKREGIEQGKREGIEQGKREGIEQGKREGLIEGMIKTYKEFGLPGDIAVKKLQTEYGLTLADAQKQVAMYYL
uniref:Transposase (putative) YhgA-like domain-containing protein n=1 Tax=Eubacterium plexicaudatum ASF492 TaxID=1235802 RepID=N2AY33_9FIRM